MLCGFRHLAISSPALTSKTLIATTTIVSRWRGGDACPRLRLPMARYDTACALRRSDRSQKSNCRFRGLLGDRSVPQGPAVRVPPSIEYRRPFARFDCAFAREQAPQRLIAHTMT